MRICLMYYKKKSIEHNTIRLEKNVYSREVNHFGLVLYIYIMKNSPHFPSDAFMRRKDELNKNKLLHFY